MIGIVDRTRHRQRRKFAAKRVKSFAGLCAYRENAGMASVKKRALEECSYSGADLFEPARADGVNLGDHGKAAADSEQAADGEMLFGLRLDTFFCGDGEENGIDAACACEHIADKELVSGNIDEADSQRGVVGRVRVEGGESQIDGDAAPLLFGQAVGVHAGESVHERRLAVVDVTSCSDDDRFDRRVHGLKGLR